MMLMNGNGCASSLTWAARYSASLVRCSCLHRSRGDRDAQERALGVVLNARVPRTRVERLAREETGVTPDTALRLARYFRTTPDFWLGIQAQFDLETAQDSLDEDIAAMIHLISRLYDRTSIIVTRQSSQCSQARLPSLTA